jgi:hypothetical protein
MAAAHQAPKSVDVTFVDVKLWIVAVVVSRVAGTALLWIARPAAEAGLPMVTSRMAMVELAVGLAVALWTGWHAPLILVSVALIIRVVQAFSYGKWGGIRRASYHSVRVLSLLVALFIASLPESSLYFYAR